MSKPLMDEILKAIKSQEQGTLFSKPDTSSLEEACAKFLRHKGYTVVSPNTFTFKIQKTDDLIKLFYDLLNKKQTNGVMTSTNKNKDRAVAARLIEDRMQLTGASRDYVLNECGEIIKTIFDNYDIFNFKYIPEFSILGQSKLKWVTDKALQLMSSAVDAKRSAALEKRQAQITKDFMIERDEFDSDLDSILESMEDN